MRQAASDVLTWLRAGEGGVVHCRAGVGRTGTILGCVLRGLGYTADEVLAYLDRITKARGRGKWPESVWHATLVASCLP